MIKVNVAAEKMLPILMVLSVVALYATNALTFYLNLHTMEKLRDAASIVFLIGYFFVAMAVAIILFRQEKKKFKETLIICIPLILMLIAYAVGIFCNGYQKSYAMKYVLEFGCTCIPGYLIGFLCAYREKQKAFIKALDYYCLAMIPLVIFCFCWLFSPYNVDQRLNHVAQFGYMQLALSLMGVACFQALQVAFSNCKFVIPRILLIALCVFLIIATATKGPILMTLIFLAGVFILSLCIKGKKRWMISFIVCALSIGMFFFVSFVCTPNIIRGAILRTNAFLMEGESKNYTSAEQVLEFEKNNSNETTEDSGIDAQVPSEQTQAPNEQNVVSGPDIRNLGRTGLFNLAFHEFQEKPLTGLGPFGFIQKYDGYYTHNIALDLMAEYGIFILIAVCAYIILGIVNASRSFRKSKNKEELIILLFLVSLNLHLLLSGYFPSYQPFWFFCGYVMAFLIKKSKSTSNTEQKPLTLERGSNN